MHYILHATEKLSHAVSAAEKVSEQLIQVDTVPCDVPVSETAGDLPNKCWPQGSFNLPIQFLQEIQAF